MRCFVQVRNKVNAGCLGDKVKIFMLPGREYSEREEGRKECDSKDSENLEPLRLWHRGEKRAQREGGKDGLWTFSSQVGNRGERKGV